MRTTRRSGIALVVTLTLLALLSVVVVAYLGSTRSDRVASSVFANRLRAKTMADGGLAAATKLLYEHTKTGNYITAMPAPSAGATPIRTEIYRPSSADDYLRIDNAVGDVLASRSAATASSGPGPDARPSPATVDSATPSWGIPDPAFTSSESYNFNQVLRIGGVESRLVAPEPSPSPPAAYGHWIRMRNTNGELIGRYAFFIEDESMKINVNMAGNNLGAGGGNLRTSDALLPGPSPAATSQVEEMDPTAILPQTANRAAAANSLGSAGTAGNRLQSSLSIGLLSNWQSDFPNYAHVLTALSKDDDTTARGWQRLDLNASVAATSDNTAKAALARRISAWIRDAWTGQTAHADLQDHQIYGNERLRLQLAANLIDYIDSDNVPTDVGDETPPTYTDPVPVIGIEKIPYVGMVAVVYEASGRVANTTNVRVKLRFTFANLYDSALDLRQFVSRIEVKGIPVVLKNGLVVFDKEAQTFSIPVASLSAVNGSGYDVPPGTDGTVGSGARTFESTWLVSEKVTFSVTGSRPNFESGEVSVQVFGTPGTPRLDVIAAPTSDTPTTHYARTSAGSPTGDFLLDSDTGARTVAAIYLLEKVTGSTTQNFGDPRYRPALLNERWRRLNATDNQALSDRVDLVDSNPRVYAVDWYDYAGNRPLAFLRNGPMLSVGEVGNVSTGEYPWRTVYLQYPERASSSGSATLAPEVNTRRTDSVDSVILDLFRTSATATPGRFNINSQLRFGSEQNPIASLFLGLPIGAQSLAQPAVNRITVSSGSATTSPIFDRRIAVGPPVDNNPRRPFFQSGDLASPLSRLINTSQGGSGTTGSPGRTTVTYSVLRSAPTSVTEANANLQRDVQVEQAFRKVSGAITTRGNVFRVLYVGQSIRDIARNGVKNGTVDGGDEIAAEYLGEAFVERVPKLTPDTANPSILRTSDSSYRVISNRVVTE